MRLPSALALEICQRQNENSNWINFLQGKFQYGLILNLWYGYNSLYTIITVTTRALSTCRKQINKNACAYDIDRRFHSEEVPLNLAMYSTWFCLRRYRIKEKRVMSVKIMSIYFQKKSRKKQEAITKIRPLQ